MKPSHIARPAVTASPDAAADHEQAPSTEQLIALFHELTRASEDATPVLFAAGLRRYDLGKNSIFPQFGQPAQGPLRSAVRATAQLRTPHARGDYDPQRALLLEVTRLLARRLEGDPHAAAAALPATCVIEHAALDSDG